MESFCNSLDLRQIWKYFLWMLKTFDKSPVYTYDMRFMKYFIKQQMSIYLCFTEMCY